MAKLGRGLNTSDSHPFPTTPGRYARFRFDVPIYQMVEPAFSSVKTMEQVNEELATRGVNNNIIFIPSMGFGLRAYNQDAGDHSESTAAQVGNKKTVADGGTLDAVAVLAGVNLHRKPSDLTGTLTGADPDLANTGDRFYQKQQPASINWDDTSTRLGSDEAAYVGPHGGTTFSKILMDRVIKDSVVSRNGHHTFVRFAVPGTPSKSTDYIIFIYFPGPAGSARTNTGGYYTGVGHYCMCLKGDGTFHLYESKDETPDSTSDWVRVQSNIRWTDKDKVYGGMHTIEIITKAFETPAHGKTGWIQFMFNRPSYVQNSRGFLVKGLDVMKNTAGWTYMVRTDKNYIIPSHDTPIRIDVRRDLRAAIQLSRPVFYASGSFDCDPFYLPAPPAYSGSSIRVEVYYTNPKPENTTISVSLKDRDGTARALSSQGTIGPDTTKPVGEYFNFDFTPGEQTYQAAITLGSTDGLNTIWVKQVRYIRDGIAPLSSPTPVNAGSPNGFSITGIDDDPSQETATVQFSDETGSIMSGLRVRALMPARIETTYPGVDWADPANEGKQSVLFNGYVLKADASKIGKDRTGLPTPSWPSENAYDYTVVLAGEWRRLYEALASFHWDFSYDPNASTNAILGYKATDAIKMVLNFAGYPNSMIGIDDLPTRIFPRADSEGIKLAPGANLADFAVKIARDYLGRVLWFDANAADPSEADPANWRGQWRLIAPQRSNFRNLAYFSWDHPGGVGSGLRLPHMLGAWPAQTGSGGQQIVGGPIFSWKSYVRPPEATQVIVTGVGTISSASSAEQLTMSYQNPRAYDFYYGETTADNTHPDYVGRYIPLYYADVALSKPDAVRFVLRRLAEVATRGAKVGVLLAPLLLVTDITDTRQKRPRPLRHYDPVLIEGQQFLIRSCNPIVKKDHMQLAWYEVEAPRDALP